jgi:hypothetical protein
MSGTKPADDQFSCLDPDLGALLPAFVDGELEADQRTRFEAHLRYCARCSEDLILRQSISGMMQQSWPELSRGADGSGRERARSGMRRLLDALLDRRVPVWVPSGIAVIAAVVVVLLALRPSLPTRQWLVVSDSVEHFVPMTTRSTGEEDAPSCRVRPGQQLEVTLAAVPSAGMPIFLVVEGAGGRAADPGLPFRLVEGFPVLTVVVPDLDPGEYAARVVSGQDRQTIDRFVVVVTEE